MSFSSMWLPGMLYPVQATAMLAPYGSLFCATPARPPSFCLSSCLHWVPGQGSALWCVLALSFTTVAPWGWGYGHSRSPANSTMSHPRRQAKGLLLPRQHHREVASCSEGEWRLPMKGGSYSQGQPRDPQSHQHSLREAQEVSAVSRKGKDGSHALPVHEPARYLWKGSKNVSGFERTTR